jgi:two-component system, OmpR family, sensor histidine kinase ArlS
MKRLMNVFSKLSIQRKWTLISALTIVFSFAIISLILYIAVYNWLLTEEEQTAERTAADVQAFFVEEGNRMTIQLLQKNTTLINAIVDRDQTVRIYNFDHVEIIRINDAQNSIEEKPRINDIQNGFSTQRNIDNEKAYITYLPIQIGSFQGYLELIHPLERFSSMMNYLLILLLMLGVGGVVLAATLSSWIAKIVLKPIQQLRNSMAEVAKKGLQAEGNMQLLEHTATKDEISDLVRMYNEMLVALKQSFTQQNQFVQDASHELRTPIQAIEGHLSLLERWGKDDPEVLNESIKTSLVEVKKMKKLMEELLLLARKDEMLQHQHIEIQHVLQTVHSDLAHIYPKASIKMDIKGELVKANVSEQALYQIVRNIMENAIHYSSEGSDIVVTLTREERFVKISVVDSGIGIHEKHLPYIFDRFYRVDDARVSEFESTGLGLSITKMLSDKYGIQLHVESEVGIGTTFFVFIPVA